MQRDRFTGRDPETDELLERLQSMAERMPIRQSMGGGSGGVPVIFTFAKITAALGSSAPYLYSAVEQTGGENGDWTDAPGGRAWSGNLRNLAELGPAGTGSAKLPVNSIVYVFTSPNGAWYFDRLHYRGTYG